MSKLTALECAYQVMRGFYGNGVERKNKLSREGYDPAEIQEIVNLICKYQLPVPEVKEKPIIDISEHNGLVDWKEASRHISGAILRCGWSTVEDKRFKINYSYAISQNVPVDIYYFSYACTPAEAEREFESQKIPENFIGTIYFDFEEASLAYCEQNGVLMSPATMSEILNRFIKFCANHNITAGIYTNLNIYNRLYHNVPIFDKLSIWWADWRKNTSPYKYATLWQYTNTGEIPGVSTAVDLNRRV